MPEIAPARVLNRSIDFEEAVSRAIYRRQLLNTNAFYWVAARDRFKPAKVWGFLTLEIACYLLGAAYFGSDWFVPPITILTAMTLNFTIKMWLAAEAGLRLAEDKKSGALELVLSTPITASEIVRGQWLALRRQFLFPTLAVAVLDFFLLGITRSNSSEFNMFPSLLVLIASALLLLGADIFALGYLAMKYAFLVRKPPDAGGAAVLRILVLPWLMIIITAVTLGIISDYRQTEGPGFAFYWGLWFMLSVIVDLAYGLRARHQLRTKFHDLATGRYAESLRRWGKLATAK